MTATLPAQLSVAFTLSAPEQCPRHADALAWFRAALNATDAYAQYDYLSRAMRAWRDARGEAQEAAHGS
jgi:hypothetical protein